MRTVEVDTGGYADASLCLRDGNEWACHYYGELLHGVAETGAMAGDSSFAEPFAEGYDEAARAAMETYASIVRSFATLGRYAFASVENHTYAELASTLGGGPVVTHSPELSAEAWYDVGPADVPSSLGGDPSSMPDWANWILDKVEGFVWPDADLDRLRRTGDLWRGAAGHLDEIAGRADFSVGLLCEIRSPEIPLAISSVNELGTATRDLAAQCRVLGDACTGYAGAVEEQREAIIDLVHDLLRDAILIQAAGFLAGLVTFGAAAYGATAINIAKISAEASRFKVMLEIIRAYAIEAKVAIGAGTAAMWETQRVLSRFVDARVALTTQARIVQDGAAWARLRTAIRNPKTFDPNMVRGVSTADLRRLVDGWKSRRATDGVGRVYEDPVNRGRQVRIMQGYPGNRPDPVTLGDYAVISQNGDKFKIPLEGNPTL